jgi:phosphoserine phosphatase
MPSTSKKQHNFMAAVAKNPKFAKKVGVPESVGEEFMQADKAKRFGTGGSTGVTYGGQNQINKQRTRFGSKFGYKLNAPNESLTKYVGKKEGGTVKHSDMKQDMPMMKKVATAAVKGHEKKMHSMAKGGVTRADGCVMKGHTKGKMVKMAGGGYC